MDFKKFFLGGIIGGIANFLLGWLVWGILLMKIMHSHMNPSAAVVFRTEEQMIWWAMVVGNFALGFLVSYVLMKGNINNFGSGLVTGAMVGLLVSVGINCIMYAQIKIYGTTAIAIDAAASLVVMGIMGGIVGWFRGRGVIAS